MRRAVRGKQVSEPGRQPTSADEFRATLLDRYDGLSKRLQQIARYVLDEPNSVALETLTVIAERCGVQPSAVVRFAQSFGFSGATQMQRLFRDGLISNNAALGYSERVRRFNESLDEGAQGHSLIGEFVRGNLLALQNLEQTVNESDMRAAVKLVAKADTVFVVGFRRAFPVSSYLAYSLQQLGKKVLFIDGVAGLARQQAKTITSRDLLIAVSFKPYSQETVELVEIAVGNSAPVLSISDSMVSPIARTAALVLQVIEAEVRSFRSLATSICLAQALVIGFAFDSDKAAKPGIPGQ
jgi:DNA-binding MurR/RpiR family transcriptional regulator